MKFQRRRVLAAPIALLTLLAAMCVFQAATEAVTLGRTRGSISHSYQVIQTAQSIETEVLSVESGQRGYLLSPGDAQSLRSYEAGRNALPGLISQLQSLVADSPAQKARADRLIAGVRQRVAISDWRVLMVRQGRLEEARSTAERTGRSAMEIARATADELIAAEHAELDRRGAARGHSERMSLFVDMAVSALAVIGLAAILASMAAANRRLAHEMSEREGAEAAQRESQALYQAIFANTADSIFVIDVSPDDVFSVGELNPSFERATGISNLAARGQDIRKLAPRTVADRLIAHYEAVMAADRPVFTRDVYPLVSGLRTWETIHVPVRGEDGRIERIVGSARDVTERDQAEDQLRRAQRMEAIGHLTGGVAHDFNNLLQVIRANLELIAPGLAEQDPAAQRLRNALHGADRASQLTRQLLAFARRQPLEPKVVDPGRMIGEIAEMLRRMLGETIMVEIVVAEGLWNTLADPAQVESTLLNLAINARDAMPLGGRLTIGAANIVVGAEHALKDSELEPGEYVLLSVSDTGHGMTAEVAARAFEPFFTTKGEGKGTGLGLSMVYGFVKQSHGHVQVQSEVGQGATVSIYLPRTHQEEAQISAVPPGLLEGRGEVILVVEDDDMVRATSIETLADLGYRCLEAPDGEAALEVIRRGAQIDLLFSDVVMPGPVRGRELALKARSLRPGLPVLFTSGYAQDAIVRDGRLDPEIQLLSKPFSRDDLARKVRALLGPSRPVVLVVEDDPLVRMAASDMVDALGFSVLEAADAHLALDTLRGDARVDILFTDIGLPDMRGPELAEAALALRPGLRVVFVSGYSEADAATFKGAMRLRKPYQQEELAEVLGAATI